MFDAVRERFPGRGGVRPLCPGARGRRRIHSINLSGHQVDDQTPYVGASESSETQNILVLGGGKHDLK